MKKKIIGIIIGIVVLILILLCFFAYKEMNDYTNIIILNRGIEIPKEANYQEIYSKDSGASFHGDGIRYHVYSYENQEVVESMLDWNDALNVNNSNESIFDPIDYRLPKIKIDYSYHPLIAQIEKYYYKKQEDGSEIMIYLNNIGKKLYVIESFL